MKIDVGYIAKLSRIRLEADEMVKFEKDMIEIIKMVENLPDLDNIENNNFSEKMKLRSDEVMERKFKREQLLENGPETEKGCFIVPRSFE